MDRAMNFREIRAKFLEYFKERGHEIVRSSSLIPREDPTLLFTNSGMVQFKRLFLGEEDRGYTRAATSQKCVRAGGKHNDLENVGYTARHHTFFEMLGNFSFGDYFKEKAILWAWELLTEGYGLPPEKLYVSVFKDDNEAYRLWEEKIGVPAERIVRLGEKDNFWAMGDTGPCGPCSEILIDQGEALGCGRPECAPGCDCDRYLEIWNLVFTQFDREPQGKLNPLPNPNIDTGMGLERIAAVAQCVTSNYDTDLFRPLMGQIEDLSGIRYGEERKKDVSFRVIADHARAAAFLIGDGVMPSNEGRGYVLRRIIRRAIRFGQVLGMKEPFLFQVADKVVDIMGQDYGELVSSRSFIEGLIQNEEKRFADTLYHAMRVLETEVETTRARGGDSISGDATFRLYDTYGLPLDIVQDVAREENLLVDLEGYESAMARQRARSQESWKGSGEEEIPEVYRKLTAKGVKSRFVGYERTVSPAKVVAVLVDGDEVSTGAAPSEVEVILDRTPFYAEAGGQVGDTGWLLGDGLVLHVTNTLKLGLDCIIQRGRISEGSIGPGDGVEARVDQEKRKATALNHTATHLLHAALREVLGDHVKQAGSLVSAERFRFDFSHFAQVEKERLKELESLVNQYIRENLPVSVEEKSRDEAMAAGAIAIFEERYGEKVRVVKVGEGLSVELCGGTHTSRTGDIGVFKIVSEGAVGANLRRIEALTGKAAFEYLRSQEDLLSEVAFCLKTPQDQILEKVDRLLKDQKLKEREIESLRAKLLSGHSVDLLSGLRDVRGMKLLAREVEAESPKELRELADRIKDRLKSGVIVLGAARDQKVMLICVVTKDLCSKVKAGDIISRMSEMVGGKGGGRPDMAQGGGNMPERLASSLESVPEILQETMAE
jgi:alanyl-tRNA synthetase